MKLSTLFLSAILVAMAITADSKQPESLCAATFAKAKVMLKDQFQEEKVAQIFQKPIFEQVSELKELGKKLFKSEDLRKLGAELLANCVGLSKDLMSKVVQKTAQKSNVAEKELEVVEQASEEIKPQQEANLKAWYNNIPTKFMAKV